MALFMRRSISLALFWTLFIQRFLHRNCLTLWPVNSCPGNLPEVEAATLRLNCSDVRESINVYHCLPLSNLSGLVEFCYDRTSGLVEAGNCMVLVRETLNYYPCGRFTNGCPNAVYYPKNMYNYSACLMINPQHRCYIANPNCPKERFPETNTVLSTFTSTEKRTHLLEATTLPRHTAIDNQNFPVEKTTTLAVNGNDDNLPKYFLAFIIGLVLPVITIAIIIFWKRRKNRKTGKDAPEDPESKKTLLQANFRRVNEGGFYPKNGSSVRFSKLCKIIVEALSDKVENLKVLLLADFEADEVKALKSSAECIQLIIEKKYFHLRDVIYMQHILKQSGCHAAFNECIGYAKGKGALCYHEIPPANENVNVKYHVCGNLSEYNEEKIDCIKQTVVEILGCAEDEIELAGYRHSHSFLLILSIKKNHIKKLLELNQHQKERLWNLKVDYFIVGEKKISTESPKAGEEGNISDLQQIVDNLPKYGSHQISNAVFTDARKISREGEEGEEKEAKMERVGIPMQIIKRGDNSMNIFKENLMKARTKVYNARGIIVGCADSGKTTLLLRLKGSDLKNVRSTRGIVVHSNIFNIIRDKIKVNSSDQNQHLTNVRFDENPQQNIDLEDPNQLSIGMEKSATSWENTKLAKPIKCEFFENGEDVAVKNKNMELLRVSNIASDHPEKKIAMLDFAGQCAYYASHQIFLSPRAFFILVLNMERKFDDTVGENACSQERSSYDGWTHRDYLKFWMNSVHQLSSESAPVFLVGTHAEKKTEEEKSLFFQEIWKTLESKKISFQRHLHPKRMFTVGFHENDSIEKIKQSILEVVQEQSHWGEELPKSWALFERFFQENKTLKIMKKDTVLSFNKWLPQGIKLERIEDINAMLQYFHDTRDILFLNQHNLDKRIILDVPWFADAFKNVITDKNHAINDLFEFASEWNKFNETGELDDNLLSAIWGINNKGYLKYKSDIMPYMENLGLAVKVNDNKWFIPCMNKKTFPFHEFSLYSASSIHCYVFDFFPVGIFHRLLATCMQIPWSIFFNGEQSCIYQTAAVFNFRGHQIMLGMTATEIQLQVFVSKGEVDISTCLKIKKIIDRILNVLCRTFQTDANYRIAFKCKATGFCDSKESKVIYESDYKRPLFMCPSCPTERKHIINTQDIIKYWRQVLGESHAKEMQKVNWPRQSGATESVARDDVFRLRNAVVPPNIKAIHEEYISQWEEEDSVFYESHNFPSMLEKVKNQTHVTIVGVSGSGKSATARHIALKLQRGGYTVVPIDEIKQIKQYCDPINPQVFVIDDVVGVSGLQKAKIDLLSDYQYIIRKPVMSQSKTLMTCRETVYRESLRSSSFWKNEDNTVFLHSEAYALTNTDKKCLLKTHGIDIDLLSPETLTSASKMFPFLCKLFSTVKKFHLFASTFFKNPVPCILREFDEMRKQNKIHYASLVLCMINGNKLSEKILEGKEIIVENFPEMKYSVLEKCKVSSNTETFMFLEALWEMEGTYTKSRGTEFTFVHDSIFEIVAFHFGSQFPEVILQYMSSGDIANRVKFRKFSDEDSDEGSFDLCIRLREDQYSMLTERLSKHVRNV